MLVKICGLTNLEDALAAVAAGAGAVGFNFWRPGRRYVAPEVAAGIAAALPASLWKVGVFVDEEPETVLQIARQVKLAALQLHGAESPAYLEQLGPYEKVKAISMDSSFNTARLVGYRAVAAFLLDGAGATPGGTGSTFDWDRAVAAKQCGRVILAGGLTPENVADAVHRVRPWGVDVASGVESAPGRKDHGKVRAFVQAALQAAKEEGL